MRDGVENGRGGGNGGSGRSGGNEHRRSPLTPPSFPSPLSTLSPLSVLFALILLAGCDADVPSEPGFSDSLMVEVLMGVHLADARAAQTGEPRDSLRAVALATLDTDTTAFRRALDYYAHHPDAYQPLYDRALDRLLDERRSTVE